MAVLSHYISISNTNFTFFNVSHKSLSFYMKSFWIMTYSRLPESNNTSECSGFPTGVANMRGGGGPQKLIGGLKSKHGGSMGRT